MLSPILWNSYIAAKRLRPIWEQIDFYRTAHPKVARLDIARRLQAQIQHFSRRDDALPEWKEAARVADPERLLEVWPTLPIVTRRDLQERFEANSLQQRFQIRGAISRTGGSTGEPTPFLHDPEMLRATTAARLYCRLQAGWRPGMPTLAVWGSDRDVGRQSTLRNRASAALRHEWIVGGYQLSESTVDQVVRFAQTRGPVAIYGFTSMLEYVSRSILDRGISIPHQAVAAAWNGGEMLYPRQAEMFELAFGKPLLNLYGSRELSAMAFQLETGGPLLAVRPLLYLEIVDEQGQPAAPGQSGRLLWTSTVCKGTPFLRYECGDMGCYDSSGIDESGIHRIAELHGRTAGLIELNGRTVNNLFWNHLFKDYPEVRRFQVVVHGSRRLQLRLEGSGFSPRREAHLRDLIGRIAGELPVEMSWVEAIHHNAQGKLEQVVREA